MRWLLALLAPLMVPAAHAASVDGLNIHYTVRGTGQTIIFVHGWTCDDRSWSRQVPAFQKHYRVVTLDLPGHGQSGSLAPVTFAAYVEELRWLLTNPLAQRGVIIVGDSFGGLLGIALGNAPPANLRGVIALDPLLSTAQQWSLLDLMPRVLEGQPADGFRRLFAANIMGMGGETPEDRRHHPVVEGARVPVLVLAGAEALGERRAVAAPSLLSEADRAFLRQHVKLGIIPDVGHQLVTQRPQETFAAAKAFADTLA